MSQNYKENHPVSCEESCMNLYAVQGDKIKYTAPQHDRNDRFEAGKNAEALLSKGQVYTVKTTHGYDLYTFVELTEFPGLLFYATDFVDETLQEGNR
jgi:hypothetical protein